MRTARLMTVVYLVAATWPLTAQERLDTNAGPITRAMTREADRFAIESAVGDADEAGLSLGASLFSCCGFQPYASASA